MRHLKRQTIKKKTDTFKHIKSETNKSKSLFTKKVKKTGHKLRENIYNA